MIEVEVIVERLANYSEADAAGIGKLMPFLNNQFTNEPMDAGLLQAIIHSPYHEQLVARLDGAIVGAATLNLLMGPGVGKEGYLEDFVVDESFRGRGIGSKLWDAIIRWCREQGVDLSFTSNPKRMSAHKFYLAHGAKIRETDVFHVPVKQ